MEQVRQLIQRDVFLWCNVHILRGVAAEKHDNPEPRK